VNEIIRIESALSFISSDDRDTWVQMAMALRSEFGDSAMDVWLNWSRQSDSFRESDARAVWRSCRGSGVTIASLFHLAKQQGWRDDDKYTRPTVAQRDAQQRASAYRHTQEGIERARLARKAAEKAAWIMSKCKPEIHAYLELKGFPDLEGLVWRPDLESNLLCIPMRIGNALVGIQMIDRHGVKKFLSGQVTAKAEFCMDSGAMNSTDWWCEGYATGLSLRECLSALKLRYRIHVTFSASNIKRMAHSGYVIADNDISSTGEDAAKATGLPYWMPTIVGEDLNDQWRREGTFRMSQILRKSRMASLREVTGI